MSRDKYFLKDDRVGMRMLTDEEDLSEYLSWFSDKEVTEHNGHGYFPLTKKDIVEYLKNLDKSILFLGVFELEGNEHIGNMSLQNIDWISRTAEYAVLMGNKSFWGKGYASSATKLILNHGFNSLNLNRIYCGTSSKNQGMINLALSVGMVEEGRRRKAHFKNGIYSDIVEFGLLKEEFHNGEI